MEPAHETALDDLLKDVYDRGVATIEKRLLLRWHDRKNWGSAIWQSLLQRFNEVLKEKGEEKNGWRLYATNEEVVALLCFNTKDAENDDGFWQLVEKRTKQ
jgi:hypothetical protein